MFSAALHASICTRLNYVLMVLSNYSCVVLFFVFLFFVSPLLRPFTHASLPSSDCKLKQNLAITYVSKSFSLPAKHDTVLERLLDLSPVKFSWLQEKQLKHYGNFR